MKKLFFLIVVMFFVGGSVFAQQDTVKNVECRITGTLTIGDNLMFTNVTLDGLKLSDLENSFQKGNVHFGANSSLVFVNNQHVYENELVLPLVVKENWWHRNKRWVAPLAGTLVMSGITYATIKIIQARKQPTVIYDCFYCGDYSDSAGTGHH